HDSAGLCRTVSWHSAGDVLASTDEREPGGILRCTVDLLRRHRSLRAEAARPVRRDPSADRSGARRVAAGRTAALKRLLRSPPPISTRLSHVELDRRRPSYVALSTRHFRDAGRHRVLVAILLRGGQLGTSSPFLPDGPLRNRQGGQPF